MDFSDFTGEVQHRLELGTQGEATDLASPLPQEIDYYAVSVDHGQRFDHDEFVSRVAERADVEESDAAFYAQAIVALLAETVPGGEVDDLQASLPDEFEDLFELVDAESKPWQEA